MIDTLYLCCCCCFKVHLIWENKNRSMKTICTGVTILGKKRVIREKSERIGFTYSLTYIREFAEYIIHLTSFIYTNSAWEWIHSVFSVCVTPDTTIITTSEGYVRVTPEYLITVFADQCPLQIDRSTCLPVCWGSLHLERAEGLFGSFLVLLCFLFAQRLRCNWEKGKGKFIFLFFLFFVVFSNLRLRLRLKLILQNQHFFFFFSDWDNERVKILLCACLVIGRAATVL